MPQRVPDSPDSRRRGLSGALALRFSAPRHEDRPLVIPVAGGVGALLDRRRSRHLASLLDPAVVDPGRRGLRGWLERRQAQRSSLVLVPDRATAMRFTASWHLNLARIRLAPDLADPPREVIEEICGREAERSLRPKPWHAV
jgi:hypothetical protein